MATSFGSYHKYIIFVEKYLCKIISGGYTIKKLNSQRLTWQSSQNKRSGITNFSVLVQNDDFLSG